MPRYASRENPLTATRRGQLLRGPLAISQEVTLWFSLFEFGKDIDCNILLKRRFPMFLCRELSIQLLRCLLEEYRSATHRARNPYTRLFTPTLQHLNDP